MIADKDEYNEYSMVYNPLDFCMKQTIQRKLSLEWKTIISSSKFDHIKNRDLLIDLVFKGIPRDVRADVWNKFSLIDVNTNFKYENINLTEISNAADDIIQRDSDRTFAGSIGNDRAFSATDKLIRILQSYAVLDAEVGYTQGMNFVVSLPLILSINEEQTFWTFYGMMMNPCTGIRDIFQEGLPGFFELSKIWLYFVEQKYSWLSIKLQQNINIDATLTVARCFQSILISFNVPLDLKMIMFDRLIVFGKTALVSFEMAIIKIFSNELMLGSPEEAQMLLLQIDEKPIFNDVPFIVQTWNEEWISVDEFIRAKEMIHH